MNIQQKIKINWCGTCFTPILSNEKRTNCPLCNKKTKYMCSDVRPVFPEERLLIEIVLGKPMAFHDKSVWASKRCFYIDGKSVTILNEVYNQTNPDIVRGEYEQLSKQNTKEYFNVFARRFIDANRERLNENKEEALNFISDITKQINPAYCYVSFSGGKDSTVISHLVKCALDNNSINHIMGDTTLEFPTTYEYAERFRQTHNLQITRNNDRDFFDMCKIIGPPSRTMRWCCTMYKTGPVSRVVDEMLQKGRVLAFLGIRKCESVSRSKYERVNWGGEDTKIQGQATASPIFEWYDADVWLYILAEKLDFNQAYCSGYSRVGCFCCPNNSDRNQFLSSIIMPKQSKKWLDLLLNFAKSVKKPNPKEYVQKGYWKARIGGMGLSASENLVIKREVCTTEENAQIYSLNRPVDKHFWNLLQPLGQISADGGRKLLNEVLVLDPKNNYPIIAVSPFSIDGRTIKIKTFEGANSKDIQRKCGYQVRKFNACQGCLKCESLCRYGAISVTTEEYNIDKKKCRQCGICTSNKYLEGGCLMSRFLRNPKLTKI